MSYFESSQKLSLRMWALAAFGAAMIHLGCIAFALEYMRDDDPEDALVAPAIEIDVEMLAPQICHLGRMSRLPLLPRKS
jgi:hypothetical protein